MEEVSTTPAALFVLGQKRLLEQRVLSQQGHPVYTLGVIHCSISIQWKHQDQSIDHSLYRT